MHRLIKEDEKRLRSASCLASPRHAHLMVLGVVAAARVALVALVLITFLFLLFWLSNSWGRIIFNFFICSQRSDRGDSSGCIIIGGGGGVVA